MTAMRFNRVFEFRYGVVEKLTPLVRRVVARNPGPFTFHGTATFIIGNREVAVIDPGPALPEHIDAMIDGLAGESVSHIIATHTHADHSPGCRLLQEKTGAPTYGFGPHPAASDGAAGASDGADRDFAPDHRLGDGGVIAALDWHLCAIHTPGHCANHICLALPEENTLFCGDQLMAWSTTVVMPPDGDVADYLASLERLKNRPETIYRPTHGAAIHNPREHIDQVTAHRLARIEQVFHAVAAGVGDIRAMRARIYAGLDPALHTGAERSILGSLRFLIAQGRVAAENAKEADAGAVFRPAG
ncbi:MAG: MBL fold metallo-hydrolase [Gammaproteobacteria bacterium]|nr:MBL fold metallo-hydrolase [Gammaproteobacteria bacterium]